MSQYLSISLVHKEQKNLDVDLYYLCTTPARELSNLGVFPYTNKATVITEPMFKEYIAGLEEVIKGRKEFLTGYTGQVKDLKERLPLAQSKEIYNVMKDDINHLNAYIEETKTEIFDYEDIIRHLKYAWRIYLDNQERWTLVYINC